MSNQNVRPKVVILSEIMASTPRRAGFCSMSPLGQGGDLYAISFVSVIEGFHRRDLSKEANI